MIEPNETHTVVPYMAATFSNFAFPGGEVSVLSPMRTFWEKVTLAHAESNRPDFKNAERTVGNASFSSVVDRLRCADCR